MIYLIYIISVPIGFLLTSHFIRLRKKLFFVEYLLIFVIPTACAALLYRVDGVRVLVVFFAWLILGPFLEAMIGITYLQMTGKHLWVYERYSIINRTSSWLSAPFWAFAGLGTWSLNEFIKIWVK